MTRTHDRLTTAEAAKRLATRDEAEATRARLQANDWAVELVDFWLWGVAVPARLDVAILQERVLEPLLGISDPRRDSRIAFVGGIRGTDELARRVNEAGSGCAFAMYPTSVAELLAVADADLVMPPKSTWFEPKLASGLLIHPID